MIGSISRGVIREIVEMFGLARNRFLDFFEDGKDISRKGSGFLTLRSGCWRGHGAAWLISGQGS